MKNLNPYYRRAGKLLSGITMILTLTVIHTGCQQKQQSQTAEGTATVSQEEWGQLPSGEAIIKYRLESTAGIAVEIMNYGGIITRLETPDKDGKIENIVLGFDRFEDYLQEVPFFGALIGRYGNRIGEGKFSLNGKDYQLTTNDHGNHLHGGFKGFDKVIWETKATADQQNAILDLHYLSKDGQEGYPGNANIHVRYILKGQQLAIQYEATVDQPCPINLTNHAYFNLEGSGDILGHELTLYASHYTPVNDLLIPTGEIATVKETAFDFQQAQAIGARIQDINGGYDHNYVLNGEAHNMKHAASLLAPNSRRLMHIYTEEPGIQFYSGNFLDGSLKNNQNIFHQYSGLCLETQHFPDSPNHENFPNTIVNPGETYRTQTILEFGIDNNEIL
ncbi:aldose epimerase family protein [Persicobacter diffluens]|uniref:Aldose 1-epimerase n=1 Tax=Persicobacter diffluens TaxID=981 RepID=A0AAN4W3G6_9BACT|nr:aldose 1-epimerase [Persicobacter diffluens]